MKKGPILSSAVAAAALLLLINTACVLYSAMVLREMSEMFSMTLKNVQETKNMVEEELQLQRRMFPRIQKSALKLQEYNSGLSDETALRYAHTIYRCSTDAVPGALLTALIIVESSADHKAVSCAGAVGLTQVMPRIWNYPEKTLLDPIANIRIGASILDHYIRRYGTGGGLSAYNCGKPDRAPRYAGRILRLADSILRGIHPPPPARPPAVMGDRQQSAQFGEQKALPPLGNVKSIYSSFLICKYESHAGCAGHVHGDKIKNKRLN